MSGGVEINKLLDHRRKLAAQGALMAIEGIRTKKTGKDVS
jgi:hypothetical protein